MSLKKTIDWKGAFIIGLAGTILVTGVTGPVLGEFGSSAIPNFIIISGLGFLLCLCLAELATMFPERTGGAPSYAYVAFKDRFPRMAPHLNGITSWAYWLGWNPVIGQHAPGRYLPGCDAEALRNRRPRYPARRGTFYFALHSGLFRLAAG